MSSPPPSSRCGGRFALRAAARRVLAGGPAAALCEGYVPGPKPQNADRDIVGRTMTRSWPAATSTSPSTRTSRPIPGRRTAQPRGVDVELGRIIAEALGVEPRFDFVAAGENLDADLRDIVWQGADDRRRVSNVMLHVPYDPELTCRIEQVVLTGQYYNESLAIAYRRADYPGRRRRCRPTFASTPSGSRTTRSPTSTSPGSRAGSCCRTSGATRRPRRPWRRWRQARSRR